MKTLVLDERQINQKIDRIAYEILENNFDDDIIILIGIRGNGYIIAQELGEILKKIGSQEIIVCKIDIDKKDPFKKKITTSIPIESIDKKTVILIDDVINSGRTMQYALMKILERPIKRVKTVALVDRKHRNYPIRCDYDGLTLSTTLQDRIEVELKGNRQAFLI